MVAIDGLFTGKSFFMSTHTRNTGIPLDLGWVQDTHVNPSATQRRAATLKTRRSVKKDWQAAWLLKAITCIDLTTLAGDDTPGNVRRLASKARQPVRQDILEALGVGDMNLTVGAVCVYHERIPEALEVLEGTEYSCRGSIHRISCRIESL